MIVDGREVAFTPGTTVLEAARTAGISIPTLCHHSSLPPDGSCRMCLVELDGRQGFHPACVMPATDGLVVRTESDRLDAERRSLNLLLRRYRPGVGGTGNELLSLAERYGASAPPRMPSSGAVDESNPFIRVDHDACIRCWRCVRARDRLNGVSAIGVFGRGEEAHIGFGADGPMQDSACEFCGMCEAVCPTDALTIRNAPAPGAESSLTEVGALCSYCGVGCRLRHHVAGGRIVFTSPEWHAPANHGLLCVKGRFGWTYVHDRDRLMRPLVRRSLLGGQGDDLVEVDWDRALDRPGALLFAMGITQ